VTRARADAYDAIRRETLTRIERRRLHVESDLGAVKEEVHRAVDEWQRRAHLGQEVPLGDPQEMAARVLRSVTDLGALTELVARSDVEEIFIEGARVPVDSEVWPSPRAATRTDRSSTDSSRRPIVS